MQSFPDFYTDLVNSPLFLALGGFALALLVVLALLSQVKPGPVRDPVGMLRTAMKSERVPYFWFAFFAALWMVIFLVLLVGLLAEFGFLFLTETPGDPATEVGKTAFTELRFHLTKITALTAVLGAVVAFPFTLIRIQLTREQNRHAENALFNDKMNAAIADLHAQRQVTLLEGGKHVDVWQDDIVRRNGAIDRLEALAHEEPAFTQRIADMLSVYLKELTREYPAKTPPEGATPEELSDWASKLRPARSDMEKAAQVMGRLTRVKGVSPDNLTRDMVGVNLQACKLSGLNFEKSNLRGAQMQGANLYRSQMQGADLRGAQMHGANLRGAEMQGADLSGAQMQGADLNWAQMQGARLFQAQMQGANLIGAQMQGANLNGALMQGADLIGAQMQGANLFGAQMDQSTALAVADTTGAAAREVDWRSVSLSADQVKSMFGDATVRLPEGLEPPVHWPDRELGYSDFRYEWALYKSNPDAYVPPQDRDDAPSEG